MRRLIESGLSEACGSNQEDLFVEAEAQKAASDLLGGAHTKITAAGDTHDGVPAPSTNKSVATETKEAGVATKKASKRNKSSKKTIKS